MPYSIRLAIKNNPSTPFLHWKLETVGLVSRMWHRQKSASLDSILKQT